MKYSKIDCTFCEPATKILLHTTKLDNSVIRASKTIWIQQLYHLSSNAWTLSLLEYNYNPGEKSLGQYCNMHIFLSFLGSLLKQCVIFKIFLHFSLPPPYTKLKLRKNSGSTRPRLFVGWGEGLDLCVPRLLSMSSIGVVWGGRGGGALWTLFYCSVEGSQTYVSPCQLGHCPWVQDTHTLLTKI